MGRHLLHVFSTFNLGGPQMRAVQLMNAWGGDYRHSIVSVGPGELQARAQIASSVAADFPDFPSLKSGNLLSRLRAIAARVQALKPDLVLTYNWGAVEVAMSRRIFGGPAIVHHEDGFGPEEVSGQLSRRIWFRRIALPACSAVVVPSRNLERLAREVWRRPVRSVHYVPNGVDVARFEAPPAADAIPGLPPGAIKVGTVAGLRREKNLPRLVRVFAEAARDTNACLIIVGAGPEKDAILDEARMRGVADRVHLAGFLADPWRYVGLFDVFALTSDTEQFPISLVEAMAASRPALCTAVGDVPEILPAENQRFVCERSDEAALSSRLRELLLDPALRRTIGAANHARVATAFSMAQMASRYRDIYEGAMRR